VSPHQTSTSCFVGTGTQSARQLCVIGAWSGYQWGRAVGRADVSYTPWCSGVVTARQAVQVTA
jgi:hypothetical protein